MKKCLEERAGDTNAMQLSVWKSWFHKRKHSERTNSMDTVEQRPAIPEDIREVIEQFFRTYNHFKGARSLQTDTFIKEVFYATKQDPTDQRSIEEMEAYIQYKNKHRLRLKSYVVDEYLSLSDNVRMIGVTREFSNNQRNRVLYFIMKENESWRFHHIARSHHGKVLDKFQVKEQTGFVIGNEKAALLFLTHTSSLDASTFMLGDYVHVEGYLEVEQEVSSYLYYHVVRMNRVH
ncbi:hypothetical protein GCM10008018_24430 [Paenibacillus marchantiophytorum]|uniref:Uncharacterized protein n=1 Tax=Paenibacillus marchantiophytorum TaxID=1619310 RepID=A0ABQ1EM65_9BACL|nr:hypothetical protein [Paenibacillus marchantiophytorum]GFZ78106.1 hypothetical protein GCM10008018_24430 [Paenibacillus marchantiophytorum]